MLKILAFRKKQIFLKKISILKNSCYKIFSKKKKNLKPTFALNFASTFFFNQ